MKREESPLSVTVKGAVAGLAGTVVITAAMKGAPVLMKQLGMENQKPAPSSQQKKEPTAELAGKVARGVLDTPIDERTKQAAGQVIHWAYGAGWGALYGIVQSSLRIPA